ncbi:hypothetical protein Syun_023735 [Stephania yunnanensis]|uniref:Uncharacterized protein n=1 Tax=Stephania yunnanensis TaxID=152371 RepID=A0AAP0FQ12_9MAGN
MDGSSDEEQRLQRGQAGTQRLEELGKATPDKMRRKRCRGSEELVVWTPAKQHGSSSGRPTGDWQQSTTKDAERRHDPQGTAETVHPWARADATAAPLLVEDELVENNSNESNNSGGGKTT